MLVADGGGYAGTNWMGMDVIQMWQAIENQDTTAHYQALTGWRRSYELTLEHLAQVQNYRQSLAAAWPPETSAASAAYIERLDDLIVNLQATYDAAVTNHDAFAAATLAIGMSRDDVKKIYDEYTANQVKLEEFQNRPRPISKSPLPPQQPPVPDGRQEELTNQARTIMSGLSGEITQAKSQIVKPALYDPAGVRVHDKPENSSSYTAPPIPRIATFDPSAEWTNTSLNGTPHSSMKQSESSGPESLNGRLNGGSYTGVVLSGIEPAVGGQTPKGQSVTPTTPAAGAHALPAIPPISATSPAIRSMSTVVASPTGAAPTIREPRNLAPGELIRRVSGTPEMGVRPMPPGAVIGGTPGVSRNSPTTIGRPAARVNPIGGVIEPRTHGKWESERPGGHGQPVGNLVGRTTSEREAPKPAVEHWDPDNPWETAVGVPPVVLPPAEQRVDPGPAIGLK